VCVPLNVGGVASAVLHVVTPEGEPPTEVEVRYLEVTARRASERIALLRAFEASETQARTDPLTGLLNRRSLESAVRQLETQGTAYALAFTDLDHFKQLNDSYGHDAGDRALRLFSTVLRDSVRPDDIVARYGGEEFVLVLPACDADAAVRVLERIRERLALELTAGTVPAFTTSFGLAARRTRRGFEETVAAADRALFRAKAAGRNRVCSADEDVPVGVDEPAVVALPAS
jgi:diguanylate cyclase (GGDEF)-like protein